VNRPFFRSEQDVRESAFSPKENLPRNVFCFFSSRKESILLLFFLERKGSKRKSIADQIFTFLKAFYAFLQHKPGGSHTNRPVFIP
jgi:hypothetical protein